METDVNDILGKRGRVRGPNGAECVFHAETYLPAESGKSDVWYRCLKTNNALVGWESLTPGEKLRKIGFDMPIVTSKNIRNDVMKSLAGKMSREPEEPPAARPTAENLVNRMLQD